MTCIENGSPRTFEHLPMKLSSWVPAFLSRYYVGKVDAAEIDGISVKSVSFLAGNRINFCYWLWRMFFNNTFCSESIATHTWLTIFVVLYWITSRRMILVWWKITFIESVNFSGFYSWCEFKFNLNFDSVLFLIALIQLSDLDNNWLSSANILIYSASQLPNFLDVYFNKFIPIKLPVHADRKVISSFTSRRLKYHEITLYNFHMEIKSQVVF